MNYLMRFLQTTVGFTVSRYMSIIAKRFLWATMTKSLLFTKYHKCAHLIVRYYLFSIRLCYLHTHTHSYIHL